MKSYNRHNFHKHTFCVFTEVALAFAENRKPDYSSASGSRYYFTEDGVYRISNHWGRAANCKWRLASDTENKERLRAGYAAWQDFHPDNDNERLYFIEWNKNGVAHYQHRDHSSYDGKAILRTAAETARILRQIRLLLSENRWAAHFETDLEPAREFIIRELAYTTKSLPEIKRELL